MQATMQRIKPKKSLGQNFLHDKNIARKMVDIFAPGEKDTVLEIGPGAGILTGLVIASCGRLILVEKDVRAVKILREHYESDTRVTIIHNDILALELSDIIVDDRKIRIIGNIPYYITSPILFYILDRRQYVFDMMVLVQLEVARRITARPSTPEYGILSVLTQTWATASFLFRVPPTVFYPKPAVESAAIHIVFDREGKDIQNEDLYRSIVRGTFGKRRKMLRSSLKAMFPGIPLTPGMVSLDLNKRPEACSVGDFIQLTNEVNYVLNRKR